MDDRQITEKAIGSCGADVGHERSDEVIATVAEATRFRLDLRSHCGANVRMAGKGARCGRRGQAAFLGEETQGGFHCNASKSGGLTSTNKSNHLRQPPASSRCLYRSRIAMPLSAAFPCCLVLPAAVLGVLVENGRPARAEMLAAIP
jgi:hypothetical protein